MKKRISSSKVTNIQVNRIVSEDLRAVQHSVTNVQNSRQQNFFNKSITNNLIGSADYLKELDKNVSK